MEPELDTSKNAMQNLSAIFERLKEAKSKQARILKEIERTNSELEKEGATSNSRENPQGAKKTKKGKKKWWDEYRPFATSGGFMAIAGKNAKQNDELYAKHLSDQDLFFHADIQGAPTVILKNGKNAGESDLSQTAQFAACFSSAWKTKAAAVDVYCVEKSQVSKHSSGGYIGRGAFAIAGERKWFRKTVLKLKIGILGEEVVILPDTHPAQLSKSVSFIPGSLEKEDAATKLCAHLGCKKDVVLQLLPNGGMALPI